jgi:CheY-like chemotaxis protein
MKRLSCCRIDKPQAQGRIMKAKLTDEAHKSALAKLSGWSVVARQRCRLRRQLDALCGLGKDVLCSHRGALLGSTVELRGLGAKQCDELSVTHGLAFGVPLLRGIRSRRTAGLSTKICIRRSALDSAMAFLNRMPQLVNGCVLLDVSIPGMDGVELLGRMRPMQSKFSRHCSDRAGQYRVRGSSHESWSC